MFQVNKLVQLNLLDITIIFFRKNNVNIKLFIYCKYIEITNSKSYFQLLLLFCYHISCFCRIHIFIETTQFILVFCISVKK